MSKSAWCDLNSKGDFPDLQDLCHNPKCKCQKQITFTARKIYLQGNGLKNTMKKIFKEFEKMWNNFKKPGLKVTTPNLSTGVAMKTTYPKSAQITSIILKSMTVGKILGLTDMNGKGLILKAMWFVSNEVC